MRENYVSIITPCYNSQNYIADMLKSVINQTYINWELIIVDDCSTDKSVNVISKYLSLEPRIKLIKLKKRVGAAHARNKAIEAANGRYLAFLDSDDYWGDNFLKYSLESIKDNKFIYSRYNRVSETGKIINKSDVIPIVSVHKILKGTPISCLTAVIDIKKFGKKFFPINTNREDLSYWISLLDDYEVAYGFNFCEANYRLHKNSSSAKKIKMAIFTFEDYCNKYNLSIIKAIFYFCCYAFNGLLNFLKLKFKL